jgi:hypothetical protein
LEVTYKTKSIQCSEKGDSGKTSGNCDNEQASDNWIPVVGNKRTNVHMTSLIRRKQRTILMHNNFTVIAQHEDSKACKDKNIVPQHVNSTLRKNKRPPQNHISNKKHNLQKTHRVVLI